MSGPSTEQHAMFLLNKMRTLFIIFLLLALSVGTAHPQLYFGQVFPPNNFTVVLIPDTQYEVAETPPATLAMFTAEMNWICANKTTENIKAAISLGDITDTPTDAQFIKADAGYDILDACGVPYSPIPGNHDGPLVPRSLVKFDQYFPVSRISGQSWYVGAFENSLANHAIKFSSDGKNYLVVATEFFPRTSALTWAAGVIDANPTMRVIFATHGYLAQDGTLSTYDTLYGPGTYGIPANDSNSGQQMWDTLIKTKPNIYAVVSAHFLIPTAARLTGIGNAGNSVYQMFSNYQADGSGGNGYLRILKFRPSESVLEVKTYSPFLGTYLTDDANQFTLPLSLF